MPRPLSHDRWTGLARPAVLVLGAALVLALDPAGAAIAQALPPDVAGSIAVAEDARQWSDGVLARHLSDPRPAVRGRAALAIGRLQDSTAVPALLAAVADPDPGVRREVIFALGQTGHRSARPALEAALADADRDVALHAVEALGKLADRAATPAVLRVLADPLPALRGAAAVALWRLADSTALEPLLARHDDPDVEVRWRVLYALEKIVNPNRIVPQVAQHLDDPTWLVRAYAARTLGRQKSPRATAYLLQRLGDPEVPVVVNVIRALQFAADTSCVRCGADLAVQLAHPHPYVRVTAATALGERFAHLAADSLRRAAASDSLRAHLRDSDAATRAACLGALVARGDSGAADAIEAALEDSSIYVRVAALEQLRAGGDSARAVSRLRARLDPSRPIFERMTAADALGSRRDAGVRMQLRAGLADPAPLFAAACASGLAAMRDTAGIPELAAAYATRAAESDPDARSGIRDALRDLAGRAFADSVERAHPAPSQSPPAGLGTPPAGRGAVLTTARGEIEWVFQTAEAPETVRNFVTLAARGYFDGLVFHRVVPNFVIQDGDPTGTGSGGPGHTIRCEYNALRYDPGAVGMALSGKDTGGSQWFINHSPQPHLDGRYTIFARVVRGMDVVGRLVQGDRIESVRILP